MTLPIVARLHWLYRRGGCKRPIDKQAADTIETLHEALTDARAAIASLDEHALGMSQPMLCDPKQPTRPLRDELLHQIDDALAKIGGAA